MVSSNPLSQSIKIVYYTHPVCRVGWSMQESWQRFLATYNNYMTVQFCIARDIPESGNEQDKALSSYSACLAIKAAGMQSPLAADLYLRQLREAAIAEQRDISQVRVLVDVAREVNKLHRGYFDFHRFGSDFDAKATRQALQADLLKIDRNRIDQFPTLTLTLDGKGIKMVGFCSYQQLSQAMQKLIDSSSFSKN